MIWKTETNEFLDCYFRKVEREEIVQKNYRPKGGWDFDWLKPITHSFEVYGLLTKEFPQNIQGLIAVKPNYDDAYRCVDVEIVESAPINKKFINGSISNVRQYKNVGKSLIAFACAYSFEKELEGYVELTSKSSKFDFYRFLGARHSYGQNMTFDNIASSNVIKNFLPGGIRWWEEQ